MASEELHIIGILDEKSASGTIKVEELRYTYCKACIDSYRALLCDYIQIAPYHPVLLEVLGQQGIALAENAKIDIQHIIKAVATAYFNRNIPSFYGNRITKYSIKLLKAAVITYTRGLLTMNEIRDAATVHQMKEFETLSTGVPCTPQTLQSMLWVIKKTINNTLLEKWVNAHAKFLAQPGMLMVDEFIYLLCNCVNKEEMYQRIPKIPMNPTMDKSIKLFQIDKDFGKTYETPDHKIQHMMNTWFNIDKASIEGVASPVKGKTKLKSSKSQAHKNEENQDEESKFRKQLRSMVMTTGIKIKLKEYHQKLIRSRLNGKAAYDRLASQGEVALPNPLDLQSQLKIEIGSPMNAQKAIMNRPLTAQNKLASPTFSQKLNILSPNTKSPNTSHINFSSEVFQKMSPFANKRPSSGSVLKFNSRATSPNASFKLVHGRKTSQPNMSGNFLGHKDQDVIPMYEKIIGEEYQLFESQMMPEKQDKRNKSATYFNSSLSTTMTRIYSAKPSKPQIPASPLAEKIYSGL